MRKLLRRRWIRSGLGRIRSRQRLAGALRAEHKLNMRLDDE
jgi:hypothetical protein